MESEAVVVALMPHTPMSACTEPLNEARDLLSAFFNNEEAPRIG